MYKTKEIINDLYTVIEDLNAMAHYASIDDHESLGNITTKEDFTAMVSVLNSIYLKLDRSPNRSLKLKPFTKHDLAEQLGKEYIDAESKGHYDNPHEFLEHRWQDSLLNLLEAEGFQEYVSLYCYSERAKKSYNQGE